MMDYFDAVLAEANKKLKQIEAAEMYKEFLDEWGGTHGKFPHRDWRVLHSPKLCVDCDQFPQFQIYRSSLGLPFTDSLQANDALLPGEDKTRASVEAWGGNGAR